VALSGGLDSFDSGGRFCPSFRTINISPLQITAVRMSASQPFKDRNFLAVIGDEVCPLPKLADSQDSVTGLLLAGIGHITQDQKKNFLIVDASRALQL
jgi:hypothetical protein